MEVISNNTTLPLDSRYRFADLPGVSIAYLDTGGSGEVVVFMHALAGTSENWLYQVDAFARLGYRVIAYDRRGWGQSVAKPETGPQPGTSTDDLHALVQHLDIARFHLVGIAGGSFVCIDYAAKYPQSVLTLTLAASTGSLQEREVQEFSAAIANPALKWPCVHLEVGVSYIGADPAGLKKWEHIFEHARQAGASAQPLSSPNTYMKLETLRMPTLVLAAGADQLAPPALMRLWAAHVSHHEWAIIPEAGHSAAWEQPTAFNDIVSAFIGRHRSLV